MTRSITAADVEALADALSACADALHRRIMKAIRDKPPGGAAPASVSLEQGISQGAAQALFDNEVALRQRANRLYVDAAVLAAAGLGEPQRVLLDLVAVAQRRIRHASRLKDVIGITADMLGLAAAIAAGKPEHVPAVADSIKEHYAQLKESGAGERTEGSAG
ncbi:hypothetical protein ASD15_07105 [Massilia sp. Root351]|jgi:hypothetical protein|uniref:hypothetical protein n=1 Tax=Massilia sp. Root351 TaxID=1736522 RepID=UPI00071011D6|nr:hypothetical protein [Massilia sp. Root351]KQV84908.1 hypothetical protein ASD15_07105 [Massilia sp. Root351]